MLRLVGKTMSGSKRPPDWGTGTSYFTAAGMRQLRCCIPKNTENSGGVGTFSQRRAYCTAATAARLAAPEGRVSRAAVSRRTGVAEYLIVKADFLIWRYAVIIIVCPCPVFGSYGTFSSIQEFAKDSFGESYPAIY